MSRYVEVSVGERALTRAELMQTLSALGLVAQWAEEGESVMLQGTLECAGEPVQVRVAAGQAGAIEDFGFRADAESFRLVCGDIDRSQVQPMLEQALQRLRATQAVLESLANHEFQAEAIEEHARGMRIVVVRKAT